MRIGIALGILAFLVVGSIVGVIVVPSNRGAGLFPGLVAAAWAAWPFIYKGKVKRYNFLNPVPRRYQLPLQQAFSKIRNIINDSVYHYGDRWKVLTADTQTHRIHAILQFSGEEQDSDSEGGRHKQHFQRLLDMNIQFKEEPNDATVVQFNFQARVEGLAFYSCDEIISGLTSNVENALGAGIEVNDPTLVKKLTTIELPPPPWWLLAVTALALYGLWTNVMAAVFK